MEMFNKQITFSTDAKRQLKKGIDTLANAVKVTLGPQGRTVIIEGNPNPHITKDGVTVAKAVYLPDALENLGAQLVKSVSSKTGTDAGDGTTTATVIAQAMVNIGLQNIETGANPITIKKGIDKAVAAIVKFIKEQAIEVDYDRIEQVATISANNDPEIGKLIADAIRRVTTSGVITLEESNTTETYTEIIEGTQFECGYMSPYFVTDLDRKLVSLTNAEILILNDNLTAFVNVLPLIDNAVNKGSQYLIIANDVDSDVLNTLVANRVNTSAKFCVVKAPYFGERRKAFLNDLAISTGGLVINSVDELTPRAFNMALGKAKKITVTHDNTTIVNGAGDHAVIQNYIYKLENEYDLNTSEQERADIQDRIDNLRGGVAVIYVGANSSVEMLEKKDRIDDALCATRAAIAEGIVPGGGLTYLRALETLDHIEFDSIDERTGVYIVRQAVQVPLQQICSNAGVSGEVILNKLAEAKYTVGYNAKTGVLENLLEAGIIDPAKVDRVALENAASVASTFLTTECAITNLTNE